MDHTVIVDGVRSPFGKRGGTLSALHPAQLLSQVQKGLLERLELDPASVEELIGGCVTQAGEQSNNITRTAWLHAGLPYQVPGTTVDCACGSSLQSTHLIAGLISSGAISAGMASGVESMSRISLGSAGGNLGSPYPDDWAIDLPDQFTAAERIAKLRGLSRQDLDMFGVKSQQRAAEAWDAGAFDKTVLPIQAPQLEENGTIGEAIQVKRDQGLRESTSESLAKLNPIAEGGLHTAATSSQISDGASAVVLMSESRAKELGLKPRARIIGTAMAGSDPYYHLDGPIDATKLVLRKTGRSIKDIDYVEINEAFASIVLSWQQETGFDMDRVNVFGGAIALGHPVGASGIRLLLQAIDVLEQRDAQTALVTMCAGGALAPATIIERM